MNMKKAVAWVLIFCLVWGGYMPAARADDSDIFGSNIAPNVMLLIDSSQSMNDEVGTSIPYASGTTYTALTYRSVTFVATTVYRKITSGSVSGQGSCSTSNPCYSVYNANVNNVSWPSVAATNKANFLASGFWTGSIGGSPVSLYYGNYLNYYYCSSCDGVEPKITIAKRVVSNLVNITNGVRFGAMKFKTNGGLVMEPIRDMTDANKTTLVNTINAMALTSVGTPVGDQLNDAGNYYKGTYTGQSSPIQYSCQANFAIIISDGLQNSFNKDVRTAATEQFTQDHSTTFAGLQNVIVHTIGFAIAASEGSSQALVANGILQTAATNGGGTFFTADNSAQLEVALQDAISQILAATFAFATPTIPSTGTNGATRAYLASFQSNASRPFWRGYLNAYDLVNGKVPVDTTTHLPSGTPVWDAGQKLSDTGSPLKLAANRNIKTYIGGSLQDFKTTTSAITAGVLGAADSTEKDQIINYIRGAVDYNDEDIPPDGNTTEERPWKLGDIFHSTPVFVPPPFFLSTDSSYNTFKTDTTNANRTTVLLAGANDGMLHAFRESDGDEQWAFIPPNLLDQLKNLKALSGTRDYYVDASPVVDDVKTGGAWKTIAVFGERRGGNNYYALNITATGTAPVYLWSFSDSRLGETWSEPAIGKVKMSDNTDKWVAFFGGGFDTSHSNYNSGNKTTESFFAIDLATGAKLWEYYNTGAGDSQYMNFSIPATPTAVDVNNDGYIDRVYIGDVGGQLWKFDVSAPATLSGGLVTNWTGKRLFVADSSQANPPAAGEFYPTQAIYSSPTLAFDANNNLWIYFGTGDRYHPNNSSTNRFYGIKDDTGMTTGSALTESSLTNMSGGTGTVSQGWYLIFSPANSGEKVLAPATVFNGAVEFTTFTPVSTVTCSTGSGNAKMYSANMTAGDAALNLVNGTLLSSGQSVLTNGMSIGTGIPSKVVIVNGQGWVTGTTSKEIYQGDFQKPAMKKLVGWREVF
jgi:type IV pilus assembly protein PilY1